jgi:hypothetical protein
MENRIFKCFLFLLVLCTGCAEQAYDGDKKSSSEVAVIKNSYSGAGGLKSDRAEILAVDDDYFNGSSPWRVKVLPGKHSVEIRCRHGGLLFEKGFGLQDRQGSVEFIAKAGREYKAFCRSGGGKFAKWITDLTTDEIVGGENQ